MSAQPASPLRPAESHLHLATSRCPTCEQPVPNDKLNEVTARLKARDQEVSTGVATRLNQDFAARIAKVDADAKAELQRVSNDNVATLAKLKQDAAERELAARLEAKAEAEAALKDQLAESTRLREMAEAANATSKIELDALRETTEATIAGLKQEAQAREATARAEATQMAEETFREQVAESARARAAAEQSVASKDRELEQMRSDSATAVENLKHEAAAREAAARAQAKTEAEAPLLLKLDATSRAKNAAEAQVATLTAAQQARLDEQRLALEKDKTDAVNAEKAKAFDDKLKLENQLKDMARQLEKKTADELGEGAEVRLLEELKAQFEGDTFTHVGKGNPGADIIHEVVHKGKVCGKIVYDSKNRNAWRSEYVSKLRKDQVAAKADHAILSTQTLPAGTKQTHIQDGVIIANPARVMVLVELLRQQIIRLHNLRLSNESKADKTAALYAFMTSELCGQLFSQIESRAADILDLDAKEKRAHDNTWKRRGELVRSVQKAHGDLSAQIEIVLGTGSDAPDTEE